MAGDQCQERFGNIGDPQLFERAIQVHRYKIGDVFFQGPPVRFNVPFDNLQQSLGDFGLIPADITINQVGKIIPGLPVNTAHHAKIEVTDNIVRKEENISWVRIGVKKPMVENLFKD